jgi:very-short-patch-repair endonuclease
VPLRDGGILHCDLGILSIRFAVEVDSMSFHSEREALSLDAERTNAIMSVEDGWRVLRVTWDLLSPERYPALLAAVRHAIQAQSRRFLNVDWPEPQHLRT